MRKTLKTVVAMLLTVAILLGVCSTAVFAVSESDNSQITSTTENGNGTSGVAINTDWCKINCEGNDITIVLNPTAEALLGMNADEIKAVISALVDAVKGIVIEDIKEGLFPPKPEEPSTPPANPDDDVEIEEGTNEANIWETALASYVRGEYGNADADSYVKFLKDLLDEDKMDDGENAPFEKFTAYVLRMLRSAVKFGAIDVNALPSTEVLEKKIGEIFEAEIDKHVKAEIEKVKDNIPAYIAWLTGDDNAVIDSDVKELVDAEVASLVKAKVQAYINNGFAAVANADPIDVIIADHMNSEIEKRVTEWIKNYAEGKTVPDNVNALINAELEEWVKQVADSYENDGKVPENPSPIFNFAYGKVAGIVNSKLDELVNNYLAGNTPDAETKAAIEKYLKENAATTVYETYWKYKDQKHESLNDETTIWGMIHKEMKSDKVILAIQYLKSDLTVMPPVTFTKEQAIAYFDETPSAELRATLAQLNTVEDVEIRIDVEAVALATINTEIADYGQSDWIAVWNLFTEEEQQASLVTIKAEITKEPGFKAKVKDAIIANWIVGEDATAEEKAAALANRQAAVASLVENEKLFADVVAEIIYDAEHDERYVSIISDEVNKELGEDPIATFRAVIKTLGAEKVKELSTAVEKIAQDVINGNVEEYRAKAFIKLLGKTEADVMNLINNTYVPVLLEKYSETVEKLKNPPAEDEGGEGEVEEEEEDIGIKDLLALIQDVSVNGAVLFKDVKIDVDAVKSFIFSLPTIEQIAEMTDEEMQLLFNVVVNTDFGTSEFNVTLAIGSNKELIRKYAKIVAEYLDFYMNDDGVIVFDLKVPDEFAELVLKAAKTEKIPDDLKHKVFGMIDYNVDEAYAFIKNTSFEDLLKIFDYVDFDEVLDHEFVKQFTSKFEKLDGLTEEQIKEKVEQYEHLYVKALKLITKLYNNLPDSVKSKNILSVYDENGAFSHKGSYSVDVENVISKVSPKYAALIASFMSTTEVGAALDLSVEFDGINKIEYVIEDSSYLVGFLPVGADVAYFANVTTYGEKVITGWADAEGTLYTVMPDNDVTLHAVLEEVKDEFDGEVKLSETVEKIYDAQATDITAELVGDGFGVEGTTVTFKWYKDGAEISGAIAKTYSVKNVSESGTYYCVVTVTNEDGTYVLTSNECVVTISKAALDLSGYSWSDKTFVYDGTAKTVYLKDAEGNALPYGVTYVVDETYTNEATDKGNYIAKAVFDTDNFDVVGEVSELNWTITGAVYDMSGISFKDKTVVYTGEAYSIEIEGELPEGVTVQYSGGNYTEPGTYEIVATFTGDINYQEIAPMTATLRILGFVKDHVYVDTNGVTVVGVSAKNNGVLEIYKLNFRDVTSQYRYLESEEIFGKGKVGYVISAHDIHFAENGVKQNVGDEFVVKLLLPVNLRGSEFTNKLVHLSDDGKIEELSATVEGDYLVFTTTHFSIFSIVEVGDAPVIPEDVDYTWVWILVAVLLVLIVVAVIVILIIRKKRNGNTPEAPAEAPTPVEPKPSVEEAPVEETPAEETPVEEAPAEETPAEEAPAEEAPAEEAPAEEAPVEETPVEEAPVEEAPAEEAPVEETLAEEAPVEETLAEETPVEETPVEEAPKEEPKEIPVLIVPSSGDDEDGEGDRIINGEIVHVRYRTSFMSRLIQAEESIQDYYTVVKNELLSYKGVKARTSWNFESFNKGRIQCAKLNVKGSAFQVYLGLDPKEYNANKYHFVDVGDKPKLDKVPMLLKVKSERGLKYVLELIEEMMNKLELEKTETPNVDYHMPYESTEALAARDLVKVILPAGVTLDGDESFMKVDVGALIDTASSDKFEVASEEAKAIFAQAPVILHKAKEVAEEEIVHVDAVHADEILSDTEAEEMIEIVEKASIYKTQLEGKLDEINLDTLCENFEDGDVITIETLKEKKLISQNAGRVKVLARGVMTKKLTIYADKFSIQAVKMIALAGGHVDMLQ